MLTLERNLIGGYFQRVQKTSVYATKFQSILVLYMQAKIRYFMFQVSHVTVIRRGGGFLALR